MHFFESNSQKINETMLLNCRYLIYAIVLIAYLASSVSTFFRKQSVGIRGRLFCGSDPLTDAQIKLWSKNLLGLF